MEKIAKIFAVFSLALFFFSPTLSYCQVRNYYYESVSENFTVNKDTSVDVEEIETYRFNGEYHQGWRSIPLNKVTAVTDVAVLDGATLRPLERVYHSLEKTDPSSWGKYFVSYSNSSTDIEWYYSASDESRTWILKYKLIGALSFLNDKDELYWNLFTDFNVPVLKTSAKVTLPDNSFSLRDLQSEIYVQSANNPQKSIADNKTFYFETDNVLPNGIVTIAAGWPKGLIDRGAFWRQFLIAHYVGIVSALLVLATIITMILYWYFTEKKGKGRGTIVPEYEPPQNLRPAMADIIVHEKISSKIWAATVVDLAVRGHLKITEEPITWFSVFFASNILGLLPLAVLIFFAVVFIRDATALKVAGPGFVLAVVVMVLIWRRASKSGAKLVPRDYVIEPREGAPDDDLEDYEKKFMKVILGIGGGRFSTKDLRKDQTAGRMLYGEMKSLEKELLHETEIDTGAYEKPISKDNLSTIGLFLLFFGGVFLIPLSTSLPGPIILGILALLCIVCLWFFIKFEARLSAEGAILREEWLGFKMYLETAEKYRMRFDDTHREQAQVTPDLFEKYLPYAIIFGVEKKWGKAFEGISVPPPNWYSSNAAVSGFAAGNIAGSTGNFSSGFSASAFSASFASSFTSSFSSSGGAGASGGGGGAGGGGGGGGGGAS